MRMVSRVIACLILAIALFGCDRTQTEEPPSLPAGSSPEASSPVPAGREPALSLAHAASIAAGKVSDAAGYGWKPGISYAIKADGTAWYWGFTQSGSVDFPRKIQADRPVVQVVNSYVLTDDGQVRRMSEAGAAAPVEGLDQVVSVGQLDEMFGTLFALKKDGTVWKLDRDTGKLERFRDFSSIRAIYSTSFSLFLEDTGGKLTYINGMNGNIMEPDNAAVLLERGVVKAAAGYMDRALIQTEAGDVYLFNPEDRSVRLEPRAAGAKRMAVASEGLYLFTKEDGTVWGFGKNTDSILGEQAQTADEPVQIPGLSSIVDIQAGTNHVLALDQDGKVYTWGSNMTGQLGRLERVYEHWTELGELGQIRSAVTRLDRPYFIQENGVLWGLDRSLTLYEVQNAGKVKAMTGISGIPVTLSLDGEVRIWGKEFQSSVPLDLPYKVKEMAGVDKKLLLLSDSGKLEVIPFETEGGTMGGAFTTAAIKPGKPAAVAAEGGWPVRIASLHASPYTFMALTEDGKVFYSEERPDGSYVFKAVMNMPPAKALTADYFVRYSAEPVPAWTLDRSGHVHEIRLKLSWEGGKSRPLEAETLPDQETGIAFVSGKLRISEDGYGYERGNEAESREKLPFPVRLAASNYSYAIEGPGSYYHLLVGTNNRIAIQGFNPFGGASCIPGAVDFSVR